MIMLTVLSNIDIGDDKTGIWINTKLKAFVNFRVER